MKNNFKTLLIFLCFIFIFGNKVIANDFIFDTSVIEILDNGNKIKALEGTATSNDKSVKINAENFEYNKTLSTLNAKNGIVHLVEKNISIKANSIKYNKKLSTIVAEGNVEIKNLSKNISIKTQNIFYQGLDGVIKSKSKSIIEDQFSNIFITDSFFYTLINDVIKITNAEIIGVEKNILRIEKAYINLTSNKIIGKDVSIDFNNKNFEKNNEPRLKGRTVVANQNETIVTKGIFTTCKRNDDCPPWQFSAKEIKHNKEKKTIYYKDAWLKIYDKPIVYFPKFFHPDPTVKRQSGFLMPSFENSNNIGASLQVPYYFMLSDNKDVTLTPRFYSGEKLLTQSEYREVNAKSRHDIDFSILNERSHSSKSHFFSNSTKELNFENFEVSEIIFQLQQTSDDTYLKTYKLKSPIIKDTNTLNSSIAINAYRDDLSFSIEMQAYENLSKKKSDRYEFVYPSYNLNKEFTPNTNLDGNFYFNSSGSMKNYDTNVYEKVVINDFIFNSNSKFTDKGLKNNYNILLKNINSDSDRSKKYKNKLDNKLATLLEYTSSYPLKKNTNDYTSMFKPLVSLRYSPNNSKNMREEERKINSNNIFSFNRIGSNDSVEGGGSLTYGFEFSKSSNATGEEIFGAKIANVLRSEKDRNLPINSSLGKKTSDIVGNLNYNPNNFFQINYEFSQDENLKDVNYQLLKNEFRVNNFVSTFEYLNENNTLEKESYLSNKTSYTISEAKNLTFETRKNKKTKLTEFYNLIYQYRNDCLIAAIEYNRDYYNDRDLKPNENIFFKLTIVPFGETKSPNLKQ